MASEKAVNHRTRSASSLWRLGLHILIQHFKHMVNWWVKLNFPFSVSEKHVVSMRIITVLSVCLGWVKNRPHRRGYLSVELWGTTVQEIHGTISISLSLCFFCFNVQHWSLVKALSFDLYLGQPVSNFVKAVGLWERVSKYIYGDNILFSFSELSRKKRNPEGGLKLIKCSTSDIITLKWILIGFERWTD